MSAPQMNQSDCNKRFTHGPTHKTLVKFSKPGCFTTPACSRRVGAWCRQLGRVLMATQHRGLGAQKVRPIKRDRKSLQVTSRCQCSPLSRHNHAHHAPTPKESGNWGTDATAPVCAQPILPDNISGKLIRFFNACLILAV
eukprot:2345924-Amphidinium_carterae.1